MRLLSTFGAVLALGQLTYAEDCLGVALTAIPNCAQSCFLNGAPSVGCGGTDFDCQCAQEAALYAAVEGCVSSSCPEASFQAVIDGASTGMTTQLSDLCIIILIFQRLIIYLN